MKKIYTLIIFCLLSIFLKAQTVNFYLTSDSVVYGGTENYPFWSSADIVNSGVDSVVIEAARIINIVPNFPFWESAMCNGSYCYAIFDTIWFTVHPGVTELFKMTFRYQIHNTDTAHTYIHFKSITPGIVFEHYQNYYAMDSLVLTTSVFPISGSQLQTSISPNPASEFVVINCEFTAGDKLRLSDALGRILFTKTFSSPTLNFKLQTLNFAPGIYFIEVIAEEGREVRKVVKQ